MCDVKCNEEGFKFCDIAAILAEDDGKPHTNNFIDKLLQREAGRKKRVGSNPCQMKGHDRPEGASKQIVGLLRGRWLRSLDGGTIRSQTTVGKGLDGRGDESGAAGEKSWPEESPYNGELELLRFCRMVCVWMVHRSDKQ